MKKLLLIIGLFLAVVILVGATSATEVNGKQHRLRVAGCGYTIVEYGIGIDCNGDTVKLVRSMGYQMAAQ